MKINHLFVVGAGSNLVGFRRNQYLVFGAFLVSSLSIVGGDDRQLQRQRHVLGSMDSNRNVMNVVEEGPVSVHLEFSFRFISFFICNGISSRPIHFTGHSPGSWRLPSWFRTVWAGAYRCWLDWRTFAQSLKESNRCDRGETGCSLECNFVFIWSVHNTHTTHATATFFASHPSNLGRRS